MTPGIELRLQKRERDQHRHERAGRLQTDERAQHHDHERADRQQHDQLEHVLFFDRQAVQRQTRRIHALCAGRRERQRRPRLTDDREADAAALAADHVEHARRVGLPQQQIGRVGDQSGQRIEQMPLTVLPHLHEFDERLPAPTFFEDQRLDAARGHVREREQIAEQRRQCEAVEQQRDVLVVRNDGHLANELLRQRQRVGGTRHYRADDRLRRGCIRFVEPNRRDRGLGFRAATAGSDRRRVRPCSTASVRRVRRVSTSARAVDRRVSSMTKP